MLANPDKFQSIFLKPSKEHIETNLSFEGVTITSVTNVKLLGVEIDNQLNFNLQVKQICRKAGNQLNVLRRLNKYLDIPSKKQFLPSS